MNGYIMDEYHMGGVLGKQWLGSGGALASYSISKEHPKKTLITRKNQETALYTGRARHMHKGQEKMSNMMQNPRDRQGMGRQSRLARGGVNARETEAGRGREGPSEWRTPR